MSRLTAAHGRGLLALSIVLVVMIFLRFSCDDGTAAEGPAPDGKISQANLQHAMLATVKLIGLVDGSPYQSLCSGTYLGEGLILTNFHCVGQTDLYGPDLTGGLGHGALNHREGLVLVAPTTDPRATPVPTYVSRYVSGDPDQDIALLHIEAAFDPSGVFDPAAGIVPTRPLDGAPRIVPIRLGNSDQVQVRDYVALLGYPDIGGSTLTFNEGTIAGFDDQNGDGYPDAFKTNAITAQGNSGGLAINMRGEQIGIPSYYRGGGGESAYAIGRMKMINIALPSIQQARQAAHVGPVPGPAPQLPQGLPQAPPENPQGRPSLGAFFFGTGIENGQLVNATQSQLPSTATAYALVYFTGFADGTDWGFVWTLNNQPVGGNATGNAWAFGRDGELQLYVDNQGVLFQGGTLGLTVYVNGQPVGQGSVQVAPPPQAYPYPQPAPPPASQGVFLRGTLIDANTNQGITGAVFIVFRAGVTEEQVNRAEQVGTVQDLFFTTAFTDQTGLFQTTAPLPRGQTYLLLVGGQSHQDRYLTVDITADDPELTQLQPIALQRQW